MLIDRHEPEDVFVRVPELAGQTDPVLRRLDALLDDDVLYETVRADLSRRYPQTLHHGRRSTPVEVLLRLLIVKHLYNWSDRETEERVADSLVLRWFCRVSFQRVPDATTLLRWAHTIRPSTLHALNDRVVQLAAQARVTQGRKRRIDGTVVQTAIHHPTDSSLLVDGVRVLSRVVRRSKALVGTALGGVRDAFRTRTRTMRRGLQTLHRTARQKGEAVAEERVPLYKKLIATAEQTVARVRAALEETGQRAPGRGRRRREQVERVVPLGTQVIQQARPRVLEGGKVPANEKIASLFEPHSRVIARHKGGAVVEFGRTVVFDEGEGGIVSRYDILEDGETEHGALAPALTHHPEVFGRAPTFVTADRGVHGPDNERLARTAGVRHLVIPRLGQSDGGATGTREGARVAYTLPLAGRHRRADQQSATGRRAASLCRSRPRWVGTACRLGRDRQQLGSYWPNRSRVSKKTGAEDATKQHHHRVLSDPTPVSRIFSNRNGN